jgi:hypothetical protein
MVVAYVTLWQPVRVHWGPEVALPLLHVVTTDGDTSSASVRGRSVIVQFSAATGAANTDDADTDDADTGGASTGASGISPKNLKLPPPAGIQFLLPALFIAGLLPHRPTWVLFFLGHVALSGIVVLACAGGLAGLPLTPWIAGFTQEYLIDIYSLTVPVLLFARIKWESTMAPAGKASGSSSE